MLCLLAVLLSAPAALAAKLDIDLRFTGVENGLKKKLEKASKLTGDDKETVESETGLRHLAEKDVPRFMAVLRSEGYYAPEVNYVVTGSGTRYALEYIVKAGQKFTITGYNVNYVDEIANGRPATFAAAGLEPDGSPRGEDLAKLQKEFLKYLQNNGFPGARIADRRVEAVPATGEATVQLKVESGPRAYYGDVQWSGLERTDREYVDAFVPWPQGEQFKLDRLTEFRDSLARTGLFTSVDVQPGEPGPDGRTPILVQVTERPPRTVGVGASYSTNLGFGGRVFWEHRNLFGSAEKLRLEANGTEVKQVGIISYRDPLPPERGAWFASLEGGNEDSDAFSGLNVVARGGLERKFGEHWTASVALEGEWSDFEDTFGKRTSYLGALPLRALYDTSNDILNPTKGFKIGARALPASGFTDGDPFYFTMFDVKGSGYIPFDEDATYVAALWGRAGATIGAPIADIPANRRFYAGGAGSVRGYGYQLLSPLDIDNVPIGGRSVLEGGLEFRIKFTETIGMVTFIEGGGAFESGVPQFDDIVGVGAGIGFRYYTPIGPVRLDVAVPLERREVDDAFQFYISLGQAF